MNPYGEPYNQGYVKGWLNRSNDNPYFKSRIHDWDDWNKGYMDGYYDYLKSWRSSTLE